MKEGFYNIWFLLIFLLMIISKIKSQEDFLDEDRGRREDEDEDDDRPDMMKVLEELKAQIQDLNKDIAKYDTLIYILVPVSCLLFLILLGLSSYEIFRSCKKKQAELNEETKNGNYLYSENNNFTKLKNSSTDSSSVKENQNQEVKNSFHSSTVTESIASKEVLKSAVFNSRKEKGNLNESNNLNPDVGGYVAPSIEEMNKNQQNKEEGKFLTNMGDEEPGKQKENFMPNPFLK